VYLSDQAHSSLEKALHVLGFRPEQVRRLPCDEQFRLPIDGLAEAIAEDSAAGKRPFCVIASAGTTNTGAVDPLPELRTLCDAEQLWLHVDGAYGAAAVLSEDGRRLLDGLNLADSLSLDPHKWLYQPFETGCVLVRQGSHLRNTFRLLPDYLQDVHRHGEEVNYTDLGIQLTRSFRALKLWLSFKVFGIAAFRESISRGFRMAELAEATLGKMPDWEISSPARMAVVCFRYKPGDDALHARLVEAMLRDGFALCTSTNLRGRTVLRMCTINPRTTEEDIVQTLLRIDQMVRAAGAKESGSREGP
jgi:glutamate/tyrosine decarboxylase-like PLP-dependent enzyme